MSMPTVRTVLGDIPASELGCCYAHEHVIIDSSYAVEKEPDFLLDSVEHAVEDLMAFREAGGRAMVDSMPCACGRNVLKLAEVSRKSGVHLIAPTGLHLRKYYPMGHWSEREPCEILADLFTADIEEGIDANDYSGPVVVRTRHRAGIIKVAGGLDRLSDHERKIFEAAAITHNRTGAPILTHTEQGTAALEQVALLTGFGVPPEQIVLSHTDRRPDLAYHREILSTGVFVEYDSAFRWKEGQGNPTRKLVAELFSQFGGQIMLGMDAARRSYWKSYGGSPGMDFLLTGFSAQLRSAGLSESDLETIFITNPARAYAFRR